MVVDYSISTTENTIPARVIFFRPIVWLQKNIDLLFNGFSNRFNNKTGPV